MYRVYMKAYNKLGKSEVIQSSKTSTFTRCVAKYAFKIFRLDPALDGKNIHLVLSKDKEPVLYHRFDVKKGHKDYVSISQL